MKCASEIQGFFIGEIHEREKIIKYAKVLEFFGINLVALSVTSESITIASFISAIVAPVGLITYLLLCFLTLNYGFANFFE